MNSEILNSALETLKKDLGSGLISSDIWILGTGQSIAGYNDNPKATALFDQIILNIQKALKVAEFEEMTDYMINILEGNVIIAVLLIDDKCWGIAADGNTTPMGLLLNIAIPNAIAALKK